MVAPMVQLFYQHGYEKGSKFVGTSAVARNCGIADDIAPFGLSVITYVIGLLFYAFHFPECFRPGKFDTWGHSHQVRLSLGLK
jgi:adiponectin receptor